MPTYFSPALVGEVKAKNAKEAARKMVEMLAPRGAESISMSTATTAYYVTYEEGEGWMITREDRDDYQPLYDDGGPVPDRHYPKHGSSGGGYGSWEDARTRSRSGKPVGGTGRGGPNPKPRVPSRNDAPRSGTVDLGYVGDVAWCPKCGSAVQGEFSRYVAGTPGLNEYRCKCPKCGTRLRFTGDSWFVGHPGFEWVSPDGQWAIMGVIDGPFMYYDDAVAHIELATPSGDDVVPITILRDGTIVWGYDERYRRSEYPAGVAAECERRLRQRLGARGSPSRRTNRPASGKTGGRR